MVQFGLTVLQIGLKLMKFVVFRMRIELSAEPKRSWGNCHGWHIWECYVSNHCACRSLSAFKFISNPSGREKANKFAVDFECGGALIHRKLKQSKKFLNFMTILLAAKFVVTAAHCAVGSFENGEALWEILVKIY